MSEKFLSGTKNPKQNKTKQKQYLGYIYISIFVKQILLTSYTITQMQTDLQFIFNIQVVYKNLVLANALSSFHPNYYVNIKDSFSLIKSSMRNEHFMILLIRAYP